MTPQELKNSIIQLAMHGRLVNQIVTEESAELLYARIQKEKQTRGIKPNNKVMPIRNEDIPFDIPESWRWVRFGDIVSYRMGKTPPRAEAQWWKNEVPWVAISDMLENGHIAYTKEKVSHIAIQEKFGNTLSKAGTMIMSFKLTVGRVSILDIDAVHNEAIISIYPICDSNNTIQKYLFTILPTVSQYGDSKNAIKGKTLNDTSISNLLIPLPPIAEQQRIVAKIEELLPLIDRYEKAWSRLEEFNKRFPDDMQKSILQMAIQGKLVEQRPEEGTGEELYQQIQAEKQKLIKAGKIKKGPALPEITEEEKPFDIPESWRWIHIGDICSVVTGRLDANAQRPNGEYPFFTCGVEVYKTTDYAFDCDAVLLGGNNASGDYKMHRYSGKFNAYQRVYVISDPPKTVLDYLFYVIKWWLPSLKHNSQGTTTRFIKLGQVTGMLVPFPPIAEQKRIISQIEDLMPLCQKLTINN